MTYFASAPYPSLRHRIDLPHLRLPQVGALNAVAAHFTLSSEPALVSLPTGTGKTAVALALPYMLEPKRLLVVAPNRLLCDQLHREWSTLAILKTLGVLPETTPPPRVHRQRGRVATQDEWSAFENFDVVIGTPFSLSPAIEGITPPPKGLFDLLIIDEAHHSPAASWKRLCESVDAREVHFTATPFRRDRRLVRGRLVYHFPILAAYEQGYFSQIRFERVDADGSTKERDTAIATRAEQIFRADRKRGLKHHLLVRTDTRERARQLVEVYKEVTELRVELLTGEMPEKKAASLVDAVRADQLDGLVVVDVMGEGIDVPSLKIAAAHSPHRSLGPTLQFIGRFVRTAPELGDATFIAIPSDSSRETAALYEESAVWAKLIPNLIDGRVAREARERTTIESLSDTQASEDLADFSLYSLRPLNYARVFKVSGAVNLSALKRLRAPHKLRYRAVAKDGRSLVLLAVKNLRPLWTNSDIAHRQYVLVLVRYVHNHNLLFIGSSEQDDALYKQILRECAGDGIPLALDIVRRAFRRISSLRFHNVGLVNRARGSKSESYRTMSGPSSDLALSQDDSTHYGLGHAFGSGEDQNGPVTLGVSAGSKIWSARRSSLTEYNEWCDAMAAELVDSTAAPTHSRLDMLPVPKRATALPDYIYAMTWPPHIWDNPAQLVMQVEDGEVIAVAAQCSLVVCAQQADRLSFRIHSVDPTFSIDIDFTTASLYHLRTKARVYVRVDQDIELVDYLNTKPLMMYAADGSVLDGRDLLPASGSPPQIDLASFHELDWSGHNVRTESGPKGVQARVEAELSVSYDFVINDDRKGEAADVIAIREGLASVDITFVHCKFASDDTATFRIDELYQVLGQAVRGRRWVNELPKLITHIERRVKAGSAAMRKGTIEDLNRLLLRARSKSKAWTIAVAQPGLSRKAADKAPANHPTNLVLAGLSDLVRASGAVFVFYCSP